MNIITLTLNPAFDIHCSTDRFLPFRENLADITCCNAGGKGVNISRALTKFGVDNHALLVLGSENGSSFLSNLSADPIVCTAITVPGHIRENLTLHSDNGKETRISFGGFRTENSLIRQIREAILQLLGDNNVITVTGRNTDGLSLSSVKELLHELKDLGVKLVIDSRSFTLEDLTELKPWLIKPNQEEISQYLERNIDNFNEVLAAATQLHREGIENVMISLGAQGALLVCDSGVYTAVPPSVAIRSTVGAGDSSIAGFLAAASKNADAAECLKLAVAFGSAACMTEGSLPPVPDQIKTIFAQVTVHYLA